MRTDVDAISYVPRAPHCFPRPMCPAASELANFPFSEEAITCKVEILKRESALQLDSTPTLQLVNSESFLQ
jgi:hypothetical protein